MMTRLPAPKMKPAALAVLLAVSAIALAGIGYVAGVMPLKGKGAAVSSPGETDSAPAKTPDHSGTPARDAKLQ